VESSKYPSEVQDFIDTVNQNKDFDQITEVVSEEVQRQLEQHLTKFQQAIAQSNLAAIELMGEELQKIKEESATFSGAMKRLTTAVAPDIPPDEEVVSFQQAINNLEKYGAIIPSQQNVLTAQIKLRNQRAWDIFWQAIAKLLVKKIAQFFGEKPDPLEEKFKELEKES
jgi:hypothetical protein